MKKDNKNLVLFDSDENVLIYDDLKEEFPLFDKYIMVGVINVDGFSPWHTMRINLHSFYSTVLHRVLEYPSTYKELFENIELIIYEHFKAGIANINEDGEYCILKDRFSVNLYDTVREIINANSTIVCDLPICVNSNSRIW